MSILLCLPPLTVKGDLGLCLLGTRRGDTQTTRKTAAVIAGDRFWKVSAAEPPRLSGGAWGRISKLKLAWPVWCGFVCQGEMRSKKLRLRSVSGPRLE